MLVTKFFCHKGFAQAVEGKHFSQTICSAGLKPQGGFSTEHRDGCHRHGTGPQHSVYLTGTKVKLWLCFFPRLLLNISNAAILHFEQRADLTAECRTWAETWAMTDTPELPAAACLGSPELIDHRFSYCTGKPLLQTPVKRDGYFPYARISIMNCFLAALLPHSLFWYIFKNIQCS